MMDDRRRLAAAIQQACLEAALNAYEDAGLSGLCHVGRWECALDAARSLNLDALLHRLAASAEAGGVTAPTGSTSSPGSEQA